jgi:hypothetical protein
MTSKSKMTNLGDDKNARAEQEVGEHEKNQHRTSTKRRRLLRAENFWIAERSELTAYNAFEEGCRCFPMHVLG